MADADAAVTDVQTEELRDLAGITDRTYRRARTALLSSGGLTLIQAGGGRSRTNAWRITPPQITNPDGLRTSARRPAPPSPAKATRERRDSPC